MEAIYLDSIKVRKTTKAMIKANPFRQKEIVGQAKDYIIDTNIENINYITENNTNYTNVSIKKHTVCTCKLGAFGGALNCTPQHNLSNFISVN